MRATLKVSAIVFAFVALLGLQLRSVPAQPAPPASSGFSFAVYGDSRPMMYLPYKADQKEAEARQLWSTSFRWPARESRGRDGNKDVSSSTIRTDRGAGADSHAVCDEFRSDHAQVWIRSGSPRPRSRT